MKKYIFIAFLLLISIGSKAQFTVSYSAGYGDYRMKDLKDDVKAAFANLQEQLPVNLKILDNYPGYINHNVTLSYIRNNHEAGITGSFLTTGAKMAYSDYSGEYMQKSTLNGYRVGVLYRFLHPVANPWPLGTLYVFGELSPAVIFSRHKENGHLIASNSVLSRTSAKSKITQLSVTPAIGVRLNVTPNIGFHTSIGYDFNIDNNYYADIEYKTATTVLSGTGSDLNSTNNSTSYKTEYSEWKPDWSGIRFNLGISYTFGRY
ncbi:MAG: hypothetical protein ACK5KT_11540 [Dysgonomonas sp.]